MNARAQLVDEWRQIAVTANSLLGVLDVGYHLDSSTPAGAAKPLAFSTERTRQQLTVRTELPLVRRQERNTYRTALINYQRERRTLQAREDNVLQGVRSNLRQLRILGEQYKIQQQQVDLAYLTVESALENFSQPPQAGAAAGGNAGSAAALTQQLINAQRSLVSAQKDAFRVWISYLTTRMNLYLDLELLPLDNRGVWIDEYAIPNRAGQPADLLPARPASTGEQRLLPLQPTGDLRGTDRAQEKTQ